ncbi:MAG TPA: ABC transporter ATP-binding protein [Solirubrobacteraceae bacterium]|jgi:branched-chain amino acid transport system ATP-binding protein|nr:ABC transporter ATP-binding protein [Solirubrobacteraceae bacterium]
MTEVTAGYGKVPIINEISGSVGSGEVVTVVGPNGAGKSTLLKAVAGILPPLAGQVMFDGRPVTGLAPHELAKLGIGYVPQSEDVFPNLSVQENLEMGGYLLRTSEIPERIAAVTERLPAVNRFLRRRASTLSGGERKMVAIARALMTGPRLLILDEPTAGLSPELARRFLSEHVPSLAAAGAAVLLVEQRANAALEVSHWSYLLVAGRVQLDLGASDLLKRGDIGELFLGARAEPAAAG